MLPVPAGAASDPYGGRVPTSELRRDRCRPSWMVEGSGLGDVWGARCHTKQMLPVESHLVHDRSDVGRPGGRRTTGTGFALLMAEPVRL